MAVEVTIHKILNRHDKSVLWVREAPSLCIAVEKAVAAAANLTAANLMGANLMDANLMGANLTDANLTAANLMGANLTDANLTAAANLTGANLTGAYLTAAANLTGANLTGAYLTGANLTGANLTDANLTDANLTDANLTAAKNVRLPTGELFEDYLRDVVPALLMAGGKPLESFAEHFTCHDWTNCPIAHAFSVAKIADVPILLRPRAQQFIDLFDAGQIPWPLPTRKSTGRMTARGSSRASTPAEK